MREKGRETEIEIDRNRETNERKRERQTERERDRETETQRDTHIQRVRKERVSDSGGMTGRASGETSLTLVKERLVN